jgi:hypothetical protein
MTSRPETTLTNLFLLLHLGLGKIALRFAWGGRVSGAGGGGVDTTVGLAGTVCGSPSSGGSHPAGDTGRLVIESVFDQSDLSLVSQSTGLDVPDLGTEGVDEFEVVGDDTHGTCPVSNGDGETTEGFSVQEIGRLVQLRDGTWRELDLLEV